MFCLDYGISFATFLLLTRYKPLYKYHNSPFFLFPCAALSGSVSAMVIYPFDIIRQATVPKGKSTFAFSTIPFTSIYLGLYMWQRDPSSLVSQCKWAIISTCIANVVEFPLDSSKLSISGGNMYRAITISALKIPMSSFLLVAFDFVLNGKSKMKEDLHLS